MGTVIVRVRSHQRADGIIVWRGVGSAKICQSTRHGPSFVGLARFMIASAAGIVGGIGGGIAGSIGESNPMPGIAAAAGGAVILFTIMQGVFGSSGVKR